MKEFITFIYLLAILQLSGCSYSRYPTGDISKNPKVTPYEYKSKEHVNDLFPDLEIEYNPDTNKIISKGNHTPKQTLYIEPSANKTFSIKYHRSLLRQAPHVHIPVQFSNGNKYPASLDTGAYGYILLTSDVVLDNKLPILLFNTICYISELTIGEVKIKDALVNYDQEQWQFRVLNIPVYKQTDIILGREFIRCFDYVLFDNVKQEAVFSKEGAFEPDNPDLWSSYSFYEDPNQDNTIMVKIPIAGQVLDIAFDSCAWKPGLHLNQNDWESISKDLTVKNLRKTHHYMWQTGTMPCQKATVSELSIGDKIIKNAEVLIFDNQERLNLIGLDYFQDTSVVLDFVNNLLWVKTVACSS